MKRLFFWTTGTDEEGDSPGRGSARRLRQSVWGDVLAVLVVASLLYGLIALAGQWTGERRPGPVLDLSLWALPYYTLLSLARGLLAYGLTLAFTLWFGYWAAHDAVAGRVYYPLLDHGKRAIPVLGLLPLLAVALLALFPRSNAGLELAAVLVLCAGEFWPLTSAFRHSLRRVPLEWQEMASAFRFSNWQRFYYVELPFALNDLVWTSMMAVARGWFLLMAAEALMVGPQDFRLPGLGSFLAEAVDRGRLDFALWAAAAMGLMIVTLDQLLWRPALAWAERFRPDEGGQAQATPSWFFDLLRSSPLLGRLAGRAVRWPALLSAQRARKQPPPDPRGRQKEGSQQRRFLPSAFCLLSGGLSWILLLVLLPPATYGTWQLARLLRGVALPDWASLFGAGFVTLGRVVLATALATLWTVPAGLVVGLSPRWAGVFQPVAQMLASFPGPLLFPLAVAALRAAGIPLDWGSVLLMLLASQWYIFFNVAAGAATVPADLREMVRSFRFSTWQRCRYLLLPAVFPQLVAGWDAATGAAWNASIVAEAVTFRGEPLRAWGLGAEVNSATGHGDFPRLAACLVVLVLMVGLFNRQVWGRLYRLAEKHFAFNR